MFRIAMTRRQMYQRGEDQNKQTGFWGMIKSVTSTQTGSESILYTALLYGTDGFNFIPVVLVTRHFICGICCEALALIPPDLSLIQQEVDALEELSRQLFLETVDLQATKVTSSACMSAFSSELLKD